MNKNCRRETAVYCILGVSVCSLVFCRIKGSIKSHRMSIPNRKGFRDPNIFVLNRWTMSGLKQINRNSSTLPINDIFSQVTNGSRADDLYSFLLKKGRANSSAIIQKSALSKKGSGSMPVARSNKPGSPAMTTAIRITTM